MKPLTALQAPWGMDFINETELLVTEKAGRLLRFELGSGARSEIAGLPDSTAVGQGGLMDVLAYRDGKGLWVYLSYTHSSNGKHTTRVARGRLVDDALRDVEVLFTAQPYYKAGRHFGSRLVIADGYLFITVGDRGNRDYAQDLSRHNGKVIRLYPDGRVPRDNPFYGRDGVMAEIWSYGHRNPQGLAQHPDGSLWVSEHGPQGGDELNRLGAGVNFGWPVITYGEEYGGGEIGEGTAKAGMAQPEKYYVPSIATAGIAFNTGARYPGWGPSLFVSALKFTHLNRVALTAEGLGTESRHFGDAGLRFRDVQTGPDGFLYVLAGEGLYRVEPDSARAAQNGQ
ncbi:MAG: PQQ-dependent sugar dehydrogenase [Halieaceae bacterium]|jgi:glucose/arabinose dehydrogenase|nr:PQQ-dependent sugar dehydrogenase [Halieaceae bacterium]